MSSRERRLGAPQNKYVGADIIRPRYNRRGNVDIAPYSYRLKSKEDKYMAKAMTISYEVGDNLYLNLTNKCPCNCTFCIRNHADGAYGSDPLWLEHEPSMDEIIADLNKRQQRTLSEAPYQHKRSWRSYPRQKHRKGTLL